MGADTPAIRRLRWLGLVASIWIQACAGLGYDFSLYSEALKARLGFDQTSLNMLVTIGSAWSSVGFLWGYLIDRLPPWASVLLGCVQNFVGYGIFWLSVSGRIRPLPYWVMAVLMGFALNATNFFDTATVVTCLKNFPSNRGVVAGLLKGLLGLSGAIFVQIYLAFIAPNQVAFLGLIAWVPALVGILAMFLVRPLPPDEDFVTYEDEKEDKLKLRFLNGATTSLAIFLLGAILAQDFLPVGRKLSISISLAMGLVLLTPLIVAFLPFTRQKHPENSETTPLLQPNQRQAPLGPTFKSSGVPYSTFMKERMAKPAPINVRKGRPIIPDYSNSDSFGSLEGVTRGGSVFRLGASPGLALLSATTLNADDIPNQGRVRFSARRPPPRPTHSPTPYNPESSPRPGRRSLGGEPLEGSPRPGPPPASPTSLGVRIDVGDNEITEENTPNEKTFVRSGALGVDVDLRSAFCSLDYWLFFFSIMCGCGSGLAAINNMAQMAGSLGLGDSVGAFVSLISIWNFLGRIGVGNLSEHHFRRSATPRPAFLMMAQAAMGVGHLMFASALPGSLYAGSVIVGLTYGAHWTLMPSVMADFFGLKNLGTLYMGLGTATSLGSFLFATLTAGYIYDYEASHGDRPDTGVHSVARHFTQNMRRLLGSPSAHPQDPPLTCKGPHCFRLTFLIMAMVCMIGVVLDGFLVVRTKQHYGNLHRSYSSRSLLSKSGSQTHLYKADMRRSASQAVVGESSGKRARDFKVGSV